MQPSLRWLRLPPPFPHHAFIYDRLGLTLTPGGCAGWIRELAALRNALFRCKHRADFVALMHSLRARPPLFRNHGMEEAVIACSSCSLGCEILVFLSMSVSSDSACVNIHCVTAVLQRHESIPEVLLNCKIHLLLKVIIINTLEKSHAGSACQQHYLLGYCLLSLLCSAFPLVT